MRPRPRPWSPWPGPPAAALRDAENLLEQTVLSYGQKVEVAAVQEMLGLSHSQGAKDLVTYLLMGNTSSALATIGRAAQDGADLRRLHRHALELLRAVLMVQSGAGDTLDVETETLGELEALGHKVPLHRVMRCLKALGQVNMRFDATTTLPLELAVFEASLPEALDAPPVSPPQPRPAQAHPTRGSPTGGPPQPSTAERQPVRPARSEPDPPEDTPTGPPPSGQSVAASPPQYGHTGSSSRLQRSKRVSGALEAWNQIVQALRRHKGGGSSWEHCSRTAKLLTLKTT